MAVKYYADANGKFLHTRDADAPVEKGAVEVPFPPAIPEAVWDGIGWLPIADKEPDPEVKQSTHCHYVDALGNFLGTFIGGQPGIPGAIAIGVSPPSAFDKWDGSKWVPHG